MHWTDAVLKIEPIVEDLLKIVEEWRAAQQQAKLPPPPTEKVETK